MCCLFYWGDNMSWCKVNESERRRGDMGRYALNKKKIWMYVCTHVCLQPTFILFCNSLRYLHKNAYVLFICTYLSPHLFDPPSLPHTLEYWRQLIENILFAATFLSSFLRKDNTGKLIRSNCFVHEGVNESKPIFNFEGDCLGQKSNK